MTYGKRIKGIRVELGLNQTELAKLAGIKQPTLSRYEDDKVPNPRGPILIRIAAALQTTPEYLMTGKGLRDLKDATGDLSELINTAKGLSPTSIAMLVAAAKVLT